MEMLGIICKKKCETDISQKVLDELTQPRVQLLHLQIASGPDLSALRLGQTHTNQTH